MSVFGSIGLFNVLFRQSPVLLAGVTGNTDRPASGLAWRFVLDLFKTEILWFGMDELEAAMDRSHATVVADPAVPAASIQSAMDVRAQPRQSCVSRGQRWLAGATAAAVLLSGLNASVQVVKAALDHRGQPVSQRPHPGSPRKLPRKDERPAVSGGRGLRQAGR